MIITSPEIKTAYKVVCQLEDNDESFYSTNVITGGIHAIDVLPYQLNKMTLPKIRHSKLFLYASIPEAKEYLNDYVKLYVATLPVSVNIKSIILLEGEVQIHDKPWQDYSARRFYAMSEGAYAKRPMAKKEFLDVYWKTHAEYMDVANNNNNSSPRNTYQLFDNNESFIQQVVKTFNDHRNKYKIETEEIKTTHHMFFTVLQSVSMLASNYKPTKIVYQKKNPMKRASKTVYVYRGRDTKKVS